MRFRDRFRNVAKTFVLLSVAGAAADSGRPSSVLERFDISDDALLVPVTIDGHTPPQWFLVDTGASITVFDTSLKRLLISRNNTAKATTPHGSVDLELCEPPNLQLGKYPVRFEQPVACTNLASLANISDLEVVGIIGMDLLSKHILRLDFDEGSMCFLKSVPDAWESLLPIEGTAQSPMARVGLAGGWSVSGQIDTGCLGLGALNRQCFNSLASHNIISPRGASYSADLCRVAVHRIAVLPQLAIGNFQMPPTIVGELDGPNLLGLRIWSRFNVTFDFPARAMYLERNSNFELAEDADRSGLHLFRRDGEFIVDRVETGSPADAARVESHDIVVAVDDQPADQLTLAGLRALFCSPNKRVPLILERGDQRVLTSMKLRSNSLGPAVTDESSPKSPLNRLTARNERKR